MRKAIAIVIHDNATNTLINMTIVNRKKQLIPIVTGKQKFDTFHDLYKTVLQIAKNNDFYFDSYNDFGVTWYDVTWIDVNAPERVNKYGYKAQ